MECLFTLAVWKYLMSIYLTKINLSKSMYNIALNGEKMDVMDV